jgi:A/G-specific adenine glycosylase
MVKKLVEWSEKEYSHLPWRKKRSLYGTLVSEIMLQQTTVGTVLSHFDRFLEQFPSAEELAKTTEEEICIAWKGLGYYRRARNLRKAAIHIVEKYKGKIPQSYEELVSIDGVGAYTANALLGIGGDKKVLAIDANLERVISRLYGIEVEKGPKLQKEIQRLFEEGSILSKELKEFGGRAINEALMDMGRVYCQAKRADCDICPLKRKCLALKTGDPLSFPKVCEKKLAAKQKPLNLKLLRVVVRKKNEVLVYKKSSKQWLSGQWEVPTFILESDDKKLDQYPNLPSKLKLNLKKAIPLKTTITKYKIENSILEMNYTEFKKQFGALKGFEFRSMDKKEENLSTATLKSLKILEGK